MEDLDFVLDVIEPWLAAYVDRGASALSPRETIGVGMWMLEAEVNNGGFQQYYGNSTADFFVAEAVNGANVDNSLHETFRRNQGRGMSMTPYFIQRVLVAEKPVKVSVKGRTHYAAPIQALTGTVYQVKGIVAYFGAT